MTSATSFGVATRRPAERRGRRLRVDPPGVGDGRVDDVRRHAVAGELGRRTEREVDLGRLGGAVRDLFGEAVPLARGEADDPAPLAVPRDVAARRTRRSARRPPGRRRRAPGRAMRGGHRVLRRARSGRSPRARRSRRSSPMRCSPGSAPGRAVVPPRRRAGDRTSASDRSASTAIAWHCRGPNRLHHEVGPGHAGGAVGRRKGRVVEPTEPLVAEEGARDG